MKQVNEEIFYAEGDITTVDAETIEFLKLQARKSPRRRARLCMHPDTSALVHEMIIVHSRGAYVVPHKHLNKSESFHVIEGLIDLFFFDDNGRVVETVSMGDRSSGKVFLHRVDGPIYHSMIVRSETVVFHETTRGPLDRSETVWGASWAPVEDASSQEIQAFMDRMAQMETRKS